MNAFHPDALHSYVDYGFATQPDGSVSLKCNPEHEARTFDTGGAHSTWIVLHEIETRVVVVDGKVRSVGIAA